VHVPPHTPSYPLSLHDALPISQQARRRQLFRVSRANTAWPHCRWWPGTPSWNTVVFSRHVLNSVTPSGTAHHMRPGRDQSSLGRSEEHTSELQSRENIVCRLLL